jgi:hypothetical protein
MWPQPFAQEDKYRTHFGRRLHKGLGSSSRDLADLHIVIWRDFRGCAAALRQIVALVITGYSDEVVHLKGPGAALPDHPSDLA